MFPKSYILLLIFSSLFITACGGSGSSGSSALKAPVLGISNDSSPEQSKTWKWSCGVKDCTFRFVVDQNPKTENLTGPYENVLTHTLEEGDGTYYLHIQSKDAEGNESEVHHFSAVIDNTAPVIPNLLALQGLTSPGNDASPVIRVSGLVKGDTVKLFTEDTCETKVGSGTSNGATVDITSNDLGDDDTYNFYATSEDSAGNISDCSTVFVEYVLDSTAEAPSGLALQGLTSPGNETTPLIRVSGLVKGDTVKLFTDDTCETEVGSGTANGVTLDITSDALPSDGNYNFYARSEDPAGNISVCSSATVAYVLDATAPGVPSGLTLESPASPGNNPTPVIRVRGLIRGDTVKLFTDDKCLTEDVGHKMTVGAFVDITTEALTDGSYSFYATSEDALGNRSLCSSDFVVYVLDTTAPEVPSELVLQDPASPGKDTTPMIRVTGVVNGDTVKLFTDDKCLTEDVGHKMTVGAFVDITTEVLTDGSYSFYATSEDALGNRSLCSTTFASYVLDTTAPEVPAGFALLDPASPGNDTTPVIRVTGVVNGDTVRLFTEDTCETKAGMAIASDIFVDITLDPLSSDGSYNFYATSEDLAGNISDCSTAFASYVLDITAPAVPSGLALQDPTSPGTKPRPVIRVSGVFSGDTIRLFTDDECLTEAGSAEALSDTLDITSGALAEGSYNFYATSEDALGNRSNCSTANVAYVLNATAQGAPSGLALQSPTSPGTDSTPVIRVSGVLDGDTVKLFTNNPCVTEVGGGTATGSTLDITLDALADGSYNFYATSEDADGNSSSCSSATVAYVLDTTAPEVPSGLALQNITSPGNNTTPVIRVSGVVSGDIVKLFTDNTCDIEVGSKTATGDTLDITSNALAEGSYSFYATSEDALGNQSNCSTETVEYILDTTAPRAPNRIALPNTPSLPSSNPRPLVIISGVVSGDIVRIFINNVCTQEVGHKTATGTSVEIIIDALTDGSHSFYATSEDVAGNRSNCWSSRFVYSVDTTPPPVPRALALSPNSPGNSRSPVIRVTGVPFGEFALLFTDDTCQNRVGRIRNIGFNDIVDVTSNALPGSGSYKFYAKGEDSIGNQSDCSTAFAEYVLPNQVINPVIRVNGLDDIVKLFTDDKCLTKTLGSEVVTARFLTDGSYSFDVRSEDLAGNVSHCSTEPVLNSLAGEYETMAIFVSGDYAYVADAVKGFQIVDISDSTRPTIMSTYDTLSYVRAIFVNGDYAYVADASSGFQIVDISDPSSPTLMGAYDIPGSAYHVHVSGSYVYVVDDSQNLLFEHHFFKRQEVRRLTRPKSS